MRPTPCMVMELSRVRMFQKTNGLSFFTQILFIPFYLLSTALEVSPLLVHRAKREKITPLTPRRLPILKCRSRNSLWLTSTVRTKRQTEHHQPEPCREPRHFRQRNQTQRRSVRQRPPRRSHCRDHSPSHLSWWKGRPSRRRRWQPGRKRRTQRSSFVMWKVRLEVEEWRNGSLAAGCLSW